MTQTTLIFPSYSSIQQKSYKNFHRLKSIQIQITYRMALVKQHIQTTKKSIERGLRYSP